MGDASSQTPSVILNQIDVVWSQTSVHLKDAKRQCTDDGVAIEECGTHFDTKQPNPWRRSKPLTGIVFGSRAEDWWPELWVGNGVPDFLVIEGVHRCIQVQICWLDFKAIMIKSKITNNTKIWGFGRTRSLEKKSIFPWGILAMQLYMEMKQQISVINLLLENTIKIANSLVE